MRLIIFQSEEKDGAVSGKSLKVTKRRMYPRAAFYYRLNPLIAVSKRLYHILDSLRHLHDFGFQFL